MHCKLQPLPSQTFSINRLLAIHNCLYVRIETEINCSELSPCTSNKIPKTSFVIIHTFPRVFAQNVTVFINWNTIFTHSKIEQNRIEQNRMEQIEIEYAKLNGAEEISMLYFSIIQLSRFILLYLLFRNGITVSYLFKIAFLFV